MRVKVGGAWQWSALSRTHEKVPLLNYICKLGIWQRCGTWWGKRREIRRILSTICRSRQMFHNTMALVTCYTRKRNPKTACLKCFCFRRSDYLECVLRWWLWLANRAISWDTDLFKYIGARHLNEYTRVATFHACRLLNICSTVIRRRILVMAVLIL